MGRGILIAPGLPLAHPTMLGCHSPPLVSPGLAASSYQQHGWGWGWGGGEGGVVVGAGEWGVGGGSGWWERVLVVGRVMVGGGGWTLCRAWH